MQRCAARASGGSRSTVDASTRRIRGQLLELRGLLERQHAELLDELRAWRQVRRIEHETLPAACCAGSPISSAIWR
jgi:hypothetical protein